MLLSPLDQLRCAVASDLQNIVIQKMNVEQDVSTMKYADNCTGQIQSRMRLKCK